MSTVTVKFKSSAHSFRLLLLPYGFNLVTSL